MTSDWRTPEQRYCQNRETANVGLVSSVGKAPARQSGGRRIKSRFSQFFFLHPNIIYLHSTHSIQYMSIHLSTYPLIHPSIPLPIQTSFPQQPASALHPSTMATNETNQSTHTHPAQPNSPTPYQTTPTPPTPNLLQSPTHHIHITHHHFFLNIFVHKINTFIFVQCEHSSSITFIYRFVFFNSSPPLFRPT